MPTRRSLRLCAIALACAGIASAAAANNDEDLPPPSLRIGETSFHVKVEQVPTSYVGMTYFKRRLIRIDPASQAELRRKIYLHELMHVAWHEGKLPLDKTRKYTEEEAIEQLAPGLLQVLQENPAVLEYLSKRESPDNDSLARK